MNDEDKNIQPLRVLSFDGGGPGCYSQLLIMKEVMNRLKFDLGSNDQDLYPADYFDLMGGVGFGAFNALLLGCFRLTVKQAIDELFNLVDIVFPEIYEERSSMVDNSKRLKDAIEYLLERRQLPLDIPLHDTRLQPVSCKVVFLASSSVNMNVYQLFRTYRSRHNYTECTLVEALCATMSVPTFFNPAPIGPRRSRQYFIAGGFHFNNPTPEIFEDVRRTFGEQKNLGLFLSLGSGRPAIISLDPSVPMVQTLETLLPRLSHNAETVAQEMSNKMRDIDGYIRLSVDQGLENIQFGDWDDLGPIASHTSAYLQTEIPNKLVNVSLERIQGRANPLSERDLWINAAASLETVRANTDSFRDDSLLAELKPKGIDWSSLNDGCMEGTRQDILDQVNDWVADFTTPNILWLKGHPGVGKSAVAASIVFRLQESKRLGSSFAFQREKADLSTSNSLWRMVAFDLSRRYSTVKQVLIEKLSKSDFLPATLNIKTLFFHLIQEPLVECWDIPTGRFPVIVVDALDECGGLEGAHSEDRKNLMMTMELWSKLPRRYKLIVTSRSEMDIERTFRKVRHKVVELFAGQDVSVQSKNDIRTFLDHHFEEIRSSNSGLSAQWPGREVVEALAEKAAGLFLWAKTIVQFISRGEPQEQLQRIQEESDANNMSSLYTLILSISFHNPSEKVIRAFHLVMGAILLLKTPLSALTLGRLLSIEKSTITYIINSLQSLFHAGDTLRFGHPSFADFLISEKDCPEIFHIRIEREKRNLAIACLQTMTKELQFNICKAASSYFRNSVITHKHASIEGNVSPQLCYSCWYWVDHFLATNFDSTMQDALQHFMNNLFLSWLEVLSLTRRVNTASDMLESLISWIEDFGNDGTMVRDIRKFVGAFGTVISQSIPHIYLSALSFAPLHSTVSSRYRQFYNKLPRVVRGGQRDWPAIQHVLAGHTGSIQSVTFSPERKNIVSASEDKTIRIWDAETGEVVGGPLEGHSGSVLTVVVSPDGRRIASGSEDETVLVWDAETGEIIVGPFRGHTGAVNSVAYSPDGNFIVSGSYDKTIRVWDSVTAGVVLRPIEGHVDSVLCIALSPDGRRIVSGSHDETVRIWDIRTGSPISHPCEGHTDSVTSVAFSPSGALIASASSDNTIRLWNAETYEAISAPFEGHTYSVWSIAFSPDSKRIVSGSDDESVLVWDTETGEIVAGPFRGHADLVVSVAFSPDGKRVISGSADKTVRVWDTETGDAVLGSSEGHLDAVLAVSLSPDGKRIASGSSDDTIRVWDMETSEMIGGPFEGHTRSVNSVSFSADGRFLASGSDDETILVWDFDTGDIVAGPCHGHTHAINSVAFSFDGKRIVSGSSDKTIRIWASETGEAIGEPLLGHMASILAVTYSPNGEYIASGSYDKTVRVWYANSSKLVAGPFEGHSGPVNSIAYSPDGRSIASGSSDKSIRVWNANTGRVIGEPFVGHTGPVNTVVYSVDGRCIISGSSDETIRVWDSGTGVLISGPFRGHTSSVVSLSISADGERVVSGSHDSTIRVWVLPKESEEQSPLQVLHSTIDSAPIVDGWLLGPNSELLLWVPPALRDGLWRPSNTAVIGNVVTTKLDFSSFAYGDSWTECAAPVVD
ncbi:WD40 repeat-like protein [Serendipita vermifera]|nr:WD40 repeat-like protein [Serendipita vermifera]